VSGSRTYKRVVIVAVLFAIAFTHVWHRVQVMQLDAEIARTSPEVDSLRQWARRLSADVANLARNGRVVDVARENLGLVEPDPVSVTVLPWRGRAVPDSSSVFERAAWFVEGCFSGAVSVFSVGRSSAQTTIEFPPGAFEEF
jgi:cell division protein FtsL